jgi:hypothetical protein
VHFNPLIAVATSIILHGADTPQTLLRGTGEIGGVYQPSQLERIHHNFARDGTVDRVKGGGRAIHTLIGLG